jgi:hypothetical protein
VLGWWDPSQTRARYRGQLGQYVRKGGVLPLPPKGSLLYRCTRIPSHLTHRDTTMGELLQRLSSLWGFNRTNACIRGAEACFHNDDLLAACPRAALWLQLSHPVDRWTEAQQNCRLCRAHLPTNRRRRLPTCAFTLGGWNSPG